jgi:hypothetical protein
VGRASKSESWIEFVDSKVGADAAVSGEKDVSGQEEKTERERNEKTRWMEEECVGFEVLELTDSPQQK